MEKQTKTFEAEISKMLHLVIHSLYSKKEIFLRELISNASDAIDRARYLALTDKTIAAENPAWKIDLVVDKEDKTLILADNGIGMDAAELERNLGTIANSGTKNFLAAAAAAKEADLPQLIGQFGVGFYAAFMVADEVTVVTLKRGEGQEAVKWTSTGDGEYTIEGAARKQPGTTISLKLKADAAEFLESWRLKELVKKYSDFIAYPVRLGEKGEPAAESEAALNAMTALWKRAKSEVKKEEYEEFYKHLSHDNAAPARTIHMNVEGATEFKALLFIPCEPSYDIFMPERKYGLNLYVRNVFIAADFDLLLPHYLRFVKGVVDSSDLPLNVSREMLQDDAIIRKIKSAVVNKILGELADWMKSDRTGYEKFFASFGRILKEGVVNDWEHADAIKALLLYPSAQSDGVKPISPDEYIAAMAKDQREVYYLVAESLDNAKRSPHLEAVRKHGYDVLFMTDGPVDAYVMEMWGEYKEKKFVAIDKGELSLGSEKEQAEAKKKLEAAAAACKPATEALKTLLKEKGVGEVRVSARLTDSPCVLVADGASSVQMEMMMRMMGKEAPKTPRILEINPEHELIKRLAAKCVAKADDPEIADFAELLYGQAQIAEGAPVSDPRRFTALVVKLMLR